MATDENSLVRELKSAYEDKVLVGFWRKLHGSRFQSGLPDVLVAAGDLTALVEFKWLDSEKKVFHQPASQAVVEALTPLQKQELTILDAIDGPLRARVVVGMPFEVDAMPGETVLALGADFGTWLNVKCTLGTIAQWHLNGRLTKNWGVSPAADVQGQLRARGEKWRAGTVVLGVRRYQVREKFNEDASYAD